MTELQQTASAHEKTVQFVGQGGHARPKRKRAAPKRKAPVTSATLHPLIVKWLKEQGLKASQVRTIDSSTIIIPNGARSA